jgi:hypothetical protein
MSAPTGHGCRNFERHEDELLVELVKKYGTDSWNTIASNFTNRTARQCRNRYTLFLAPGLNNGPWTPEEDEILKRQYEVTGPKWALLRQFFPGRTDLNIKNRFVFLTRNCPEIRPLKQRYAPEHGEANQEAPPRPTKKRASDGCAVPVTFDALFQSIPYYMNRCLLLEAILEAHQLPVPPHGVCDEWNPTTVAEEQVAADGDALPLIPPTDEPHKH